MLIIIVAIIIGVAIYTEAYKPLNKIFANLDASQVESIQACYRGYVAELSDEEIALLVPKLNQVKLVGRGTQEYREYDGSDGQQFQIRLKDGTEFHFSANSWFCIINNEKGYKTEDVLCGEIYTLYRGIILKNFPQVEH